MRRIVRSQSATNSQSKKIWALQEAVKFCSSPGRARTLCQTYHSNNCRLSDDQWSLVDRYLTKAFANMEGDEEGEMIREYIKNNYSI